MCIRMRLSNLQEYIVDELLAKLQVNPLGPAVPPGEASAGLILPRQFNVHLTRSSQELYGRLTASIESLLLKCSEKRDKLRRYARKTRS